MEPETEEQVYPVPLLPPEIWRKILDLAANSFPAPIPQHDHAFQFRTTYPNFSSRDRQSLQLASTSTKLAMSLVCHTWNQLSKEFLYEVVNITYFSQIQALARTLREKADEGIEGAAHPAWWIRCVEIDLPLTNDQAVEWAQTLKLIVSYGMLEHYFHLAEGFPNESHVNSFVLHQLIPPLPSSSQANEGIEGANPRDQTRPLEALHLSDIPTYPFAYHVRGYADILGPSLSQLKCLTLGVTESATYFNEISSGEIHLPSLHTLRVWGDYNVLSKPALWKLPSLKAFSASRRKLPRSEDSNTTLGNFFSIHGRSLEELEIDDRTWKADKIHADCPNIRTLRIPAEDLSRFNLQNLLFPKITHLALTRVMEHMRIGMAMSLFEAMEPFTNLKIVQDLDYTATPAKSRLPSPRRTNTPKHLALLDELNYRLSERGVTLIDWTDTSMGKVPSTQSAITK